MKFNDAVFWSSQAWGSWKEKTGLICEVVPPGQLPKIRRPGWGSPRDHESYVVAVKLTPMSKDRFYWPRVKDLRLVGEAEG